MKTISVINQKGGVGKTTTALAIGSGLMHKGKKVLFADLDKQRNLSFTINGNADTVTSVPELKALQQKYDYCIVDCPRVLTDETVEALLMTDYCIIPVNADRFSYNAVIQFMTAYKEIRAKNQNIKISAFVMTEYDQRSNISKQFLEAFESLAKQLGASVYTIRRSIKVSEAQALQIHDLFEYAPKSSAAKDYQKLVDRIAILRKAK